MKPTHWVFLFLAFNLFLPHFPNTNPASRLAALSGFADSGGFAIDPYVSWTIDWARAPDGHYYSNKAPGGILLGVPVFLAVDHFVTAGAKTQEERMAARRAALGAYNAALSFFLQTLPFALLAWALLEHLRAKGMGVAGLHYTALALLFGNTASLFMNVYFGHAMAAASFLGMALAMAEERWFLAGLGLGGGILCDYGGLCLVPGVLAVAAWAPGQRARRLAALALGMFLPLLGMAAYHTVCFGRPWHTALQYEAPQWTDTATGTHPLLGMFGYSPHFERILQLLFGPYRGILFTQPWLLLVLAAGARLRLKEWRGVGLAAGAGFGLLLWLNSSFLGWHAGASSGPRYLSIVFPLFAVLSGFAYDQAGRRGKGLLWAALAPSLVLAVLVFATNPYARENMSLWPAMIESGRLEHFDMLVRVFLVGIVFGWGVWIAGERGKMVSFDAKENRP